MSFFPTKQRGSVLFLILICVALFAALSFTFTQSGRSGTTGTKEQAKTLASQYLQFLLSVRQGMQRVMVSNGCAYNEISTVNSVYKRLDSTPVDDRGDANAPSSKRCHLFDPAGAAIPIFLPTNSPFLMSDDEAIATPASTVSNRAGHFGTRIGNARYVGTDQNDIIFYTRFIKTPLCLAMLDIIGKSSTSVPVDTFDTNGAAFWWSDLSDATYINPINASNISDSGIFVVRASSAQDSCYMGIVLFER